MKNLSKFYAVSAIYLGLASSIDARPAQADREPAASLGERGSSPEQDRFQHPMLEPRHGHDARGRSAEGPRIERRGMDETRQDGQMRRDVVPGASRSGEASAAAERRRREQLLQDR